MYSFLVIGWDSALWPCQDCGGVWGLCPGWGARRAGLAFRGLSCWGVLGRFWAWSMIAICMPVLQSWGGYWWFGGGGGLWDVSKVESSARTCTSLSEVYPDWKLQWHFTCGFDFRHGLWLPFVAGFAVLKGLSANPTKWLNTKKQFVWVYLTILCGWHLKDCPLNSLNLCWMFRRTDCSSTRIITRV